MGDMTSLDTPKDDRLPGLTALLYTDMVERHLEPHIRQASNGILECRIAYVRYRPRGECVAGYVLTHQKHPSGTLQELLWYGVCFTPETFANAYRRVVAKPWVKPTFGPPFIALTDYKILLFAYPNDRRLDGLRILKRKDTLREFLCNRLPRERWPSADEKLATSVVRYIPEHRAVLRCEAESQPRSSDAAIYLRVYPSQRSATAMHSVMSDLFGWLGSHADLGIPKPLASDRDQNILVLDTLPGVGLKSVLGTTHAREALERTAEALAVLHGYRDSKLPRWTVADHLAKARRAIHLLAKFSPELRKQIEEIGHALHTQAPRDQDCASGFVHGDFHYGQVLIHPTKVGILDFDQAYTGPVVADLGNLLAHLRYQHIKGRQPEDTSLTEAFLEAYARRSTQKPLAPEVISWWTALALLRKSVKPIRRPDADGPNKIRERIEEVEGVLRCK
jgi:aminoglycoside phosphotransferase (APT) family kinase protein